MVSDRVFLSALARLNYPEEPARIIRADKPHLRAGVARKVQQQVSPAASAADIEVKGGVALTVHELIFVLRFSEVMPIQLPGSAGRIEHTVEDGSAVVGPGQTMRGPVKLFTEMLTGTK